MSWNIGFSRNLLLKLHNKLGLFHIVLEEKSQKISLTIIESQNLPYLQNLDVESQISHFEWTLHNGRRKIHICDKPVNLGNFVFDEENHERKTWKLFGRTCNRSLLVFLCQFFVIVLMLVCAIVRIMLSTTCEETTVWVAILSSTVGYILPSPKL